MSTVPVPSDTYVDVTGDERSAAAGPSGGGSATKRGGAPGALVAGIRRLGLVATAGGYLGGHLTLARKTGSRDPAFARPESHEGAGGEEERRGTAGSSGRP